MYRIGLFLLVCCCATASAEVIKKEKMESFSYLKIEFDGHTYIQCVSLWNLSSNQLLHDPDCRCIEKKEREIKEYLNKVREKTGKQ